MPTTFTAAFRELGYVLPNPQGVWSAEKSDGVCITLWQKELSRNESKLPVMRRDGFGPVEQWGHLPANAIRKRHLARALQEFDGDVDVVVLLGTPGEGYKDAYAWDASRPGRWRVTHLYDTGEFEAELIV